MDAVVFQFHLFIQVGVNLLTNCSSAVWQHTARKNMLTEKPWIFFPMFTQTYSHQKQVQWKPLDLISQATPFAELRKAPLLCEECGLQDQPMDLIEGHKGEWCCGLIGKN